MRILIPLCTSLLWACSPSAQVKSTTPIASLQSYQVALVRVAAAPGLEYYTPVLEFSAAEAILSKCSFVRVVGPTQIANLRPDLIVDLTIRNTARGGSGYITNPNLAVVDVTMVLSDGQDESLLGSTEIQGKSSGVGNGQDPESQALVAVAKRVSAVLANSGVTDSELPGQSPRLSHLCGNPSLENRWSHQQISHQRRWPTMRGRNSFVRRISLAPKCTSQEQQRW
ncbi:MAG: hypothetical protein JKY56_14440 [Kofleriaceae bacterium]|nr:hypothetical protein [Kofleriaceae bacterium]